MCGLMFGQDILLWVCFGDTIHKSTLLACHDCCFPKITEIYFTNLHDYVLAKLFHFTYSAKFNAVIAA